MSDRHTEQDVAQSAAVEHERLKSLVNSMADGVLSLDENLRVALYNGAALDVLDSNASIDQKQISELLKIKDKQNQPIDVARLITGAITPKTFRDYTIEYSDGSHANLYISIAPVKSGYGQNLSQGYVVVLRDITREKSLEEERDEFISVISHELRTPVTIAEGNLSNALIMAEKTGDLSKIIKGLQESHNQIMFLADMINDLATLSRAERGKLTFSVEDINVKALLEELHTAYEPEAQKKNISLELQLDPQLELLRSSKLYVHEILQNLITNAIKYTEEGSVRIEAAQKNGGVRISVQDSGIGISKQDQQKLFNKFFRSEDYRTRKHSGTGLGLYVTMKLLRLIHADIDFASELNKGTTFTVTIPNL